MSRVRIRDSVKIFKLTHISITTSDCDFLDGFKVFEEKAFVCTRNRTQRPYFGKVTGLHLFCMDLGTSAVVTTKGGARCT